MLNLYAHVETKSSLLFDAEDPIGPDNDEWLIRYVARSAQVIAAWGANAEPARANYVCERLVGVFGRPIWCLGTTKAGHPKHPLYLPKNTERVIYCHKEKPDVR